MNRSQDTLSVLLVVGMSVVCFGAAHAGKTHSLADGHVVDLAAEHTCQSKENLQKWKMYLDRPHPSVAMLRTYFREAAQEFGVPAEILEVIGKVESNWTQIGPSIDGGWGIMHLVENHYCDTLGEAAGMLGVERQVLRDDARQNIRAAAALLAKYAGAERVNFKKLEDWFDVAKRFSGLADDELREMQAHEYYRKLRDGAESSTLWGEKVRITGRAHIDIEHRLVHKAARAAAKSTGVPSAEISIQSSSPDYEPAILSLTACNFTTGRNHAIDTWVNHWIGVGTYAGAISWFKNCSAGASNHFVIRASDGEITQVVRVSDTAWHTGASGYPYNNSRSIGVEHEVTITNPDQWNSYPMLTASAAMARYLSDVHGIAKTRSLPGIRGHNEMPGTATACPGNLPWDAWMNYLLNGGGGTCGISAGKTVQVVNVSTSLRVRSCAGLSCSQTGSRSNGATGVIQLGPQYVDGYTWWKIRWNADGLEGWSAEGQSGVCWLQDVTPATVTISATVSNASEFLLQSAQFSVARTGDTSAGLLVYYNVQGTASNGLDYAQLPGTIPIPAGATSQTIGVIPIADDLAEGDETVTLTLLPNPTYILGTPSSATVTIRDKPVDAWKYQCFGPDANNPSIAADDADPDGDGILNLAEYALDLNPLVATLQGLPAASVEENFLTLTYTRRRPPPADITYGGEVSADLLAWCGVSCTVTQVVDNGNNTESVKVRDAVPASSAPQRFIRLKVTRIP